MEQTKKIAIVGAGGLGREVYCILKSINNITPTWEFIGFFDDNMSVGERNEYGEILGNIKDLNNWNEALNIVIAIGNGCVVKQIADKIINSNISYPNIIAPDVRIVDVNRLNIGIGNIISYVSHISCGISIGNFNLMNGFCAVGHDVKIGNYNTIMPNVNISGNVIIGDENFLGVKSTILQNTKIGNKTRIGANSVIIRNTKDDNLYIGNPATKVKF